MLRRPGQVEGTRDRQYWTTLLHQQRGARRHTLGTTPHTIISETKEEHSNEWQNRPGQRTDQRDGGGVTDNESLKREGQLDQVVGKVKETAARVVEKVKEKVEKAMDTI
jgi:uncharacterized protein YjbJ (UPF0337 family)